MDRVLHERIERLRQSGAGTAAGGARQGLEKESLRVGPDGRIAQTPHPPALGAALTHPYITTDYSEALLEFITPPAANAAESMDFLQDIHRFVYPHLGDELLWVASMPCRVRTDADVPVAWYGKSNVGTMKRVYRFGLGHRYGRTMQTISGVHFNYSFAPWLLEELAGFGAAGADASARYFGVLRNFRRWGWLVLFLFGASPALCRSFPVTDVAGLEEFDERTWYLPYATSLRMSDVGYKNKVQSQIQISVNGLDEYIQGLTRAILTPWPEYETIGTRVNGEYRQLSTNILQIENEYYGLMRPKRVARSGETPTNALRRGGVEYLEMRALDLNALLPLGVDRQQLLFLEALLHLCLIADSPPISPPEQEQIDSNLARVARAGRTPGLMLTDRGRQRPLAEWAQALCQGCAQAAALIDQGTGSHACEESVAAVSRRVREPELTPSARILAMMREQGECFSDLGLRLSRQHRQTLEDLGPLDDARRILFEETARKSLADQTGIEAADRIGFEEYLARYFAQSEEPGTA